MKLSLKCACGAEFNGEDSGTGYSIIDRSDKWLAMHKPCLKSTREWKSMLDADITKLWPFTTYQDSSLRFARDFEDALKRINT